MKNSQFYSFLKLSLFWGFFLLKIGYYFAQPQHEIDSLKILLRNAEQGDSVYIVTHLHIGTQFLYLQQLDSAQTYTEEAWKFNNSERFPRLTMYALNRKGIIASEFGDYPTSIQYLTEGLALCKSHNDTIGIKSQYLALGRTYMYLEEWDVATDYYFKGLKLAEEQGNLEDQYIAFHNLSIPFSYSGQPKQALLYKRKSLSIPGYSPPPFRKIATYMGMADNFVDLVTYDSASIYAEKALQIAKNMDHTPFQVQIYNVLANVSIKQKFYSQALAYIDTQAVLLNTRDSLILGNHLIYKAYSLFGLNRYEEAFNVNQNVLRIAQTLGNLLMLDNGYDQLYTFYKELNRPTEALYFREKRRAIEDSLNIEGKRKELDRLEMVYETQKREKELKELQTEAKRQQQTLRSRTLGIWMIGGIPLLGIMGAFLFFRNRILRTQLQRSLTEQRLLRAQMNPYFFFHALSTLERSILKGEDKTTSLHYLSRFAKLMRNILEGSRTEFIPLEEEIENLENYLELQRLRHDFSFAYEIEVAHSVDRENWGIPSMLLQPVVEQAIEGRLLPHKELGKLSLDFHSKAGKLEVTIEDNGGADENEYVHSIPDKQGLPSGTQLVNQRLALLNTQQFKQGRMEIQGLTNAQGTSVGTRVVVQLPVYHLL